MQARSGGSYNNLPSGRQPQETGFCGVCDEDHQAEFAQFAHPTEKALPADLKGFGGPNGIEDRDGRVCWSLDKDKQMNHAVIDDTLRGKVVLKLYDTDSSRSK